MRRWIYFATLLFSAFTLNADEIDDLLIEKGGGFDSAEVDVERPSSLTNLETEPSAIVNGSVNVISGDFTTAETDMALPCGEPLALQRCYQSSDPNTGSMCKSWNYNHFGMLTEGKRKGKHDKKIYTASILGAYGSQLTYEERDKNRYTLSKLCIENGLTNISQGTISGRTNTKNDRLDYNKLTKQWVLMSGGGERSIFEKIKHTDSYLLTKENKGNGNSIDYQYDKANRLLKVETKNREGTSLASYNYNFRRQPGTKYGFICDVTSHDQRKVTYIFDRIKVGAHEGYYLLEAQRPEGPTEYFTYSNKKGEDYPRLIRKNFSDNRFQEIEYYTKGAHQLPHYVVHLNESNNPFIGRVKLQKAPVGTDATPIITHQFCYHGNTRKKKDTYDTREVLDGYTQVFDAYNRMTSYAFDAGHRLVNVEKYLTSGELYTSERMYWGDPNYHFEGCLRARSFTSDKEGMQFCKHIEYDHSYNVLEEHLWGNHSGWNSVPIQLQVNGVPFGNGCESSVKSYTYSGDGRNLLLSETEGPKTIHYGYHPNTDLLDAKITLVNGAVVMREFYEYNANATVAVEIIDDGTSFEKQDLTNVTERHLKITQSTTNAPIGLPAVVEEKVLDMAGGTEILLQRTVNHYSPQGRLIRKEVFDGNEQFAYACEWDYDAHGNVTRETNALGHSILRHYDVHNNLVSEQGPRPGSHTDYLYDFSNRLIRKELIADNGQRLTEHYRYDYVSQKTGQTDIYGNETRYIYDEFGRLTQTIHPAVLNEEGQPIEPITKTTYDPMSFPRAITDACGSTVYKRHTIKGKPCHIVYPDGTEEKNVYNFNGTLQKTIHMNGTYSLFTYDGLQRLISKETYSPSGQILTATSSTYNAFHLLSKTDAAGYVTHYRYDAAGRLIETQKGDSRLSKEYDALGRVCKTCSYFSSGENDYVATVNVYDAANQVIEEREEDHRGRILKHISYSYDEAGNKIAVTVHTEAGPATTYTEFDYCNRPTKMIDPLGHATITTYDDNHCNALGQTVPYQETTDPLGIITACMKDALGRVVQVLKKNPLGQVIQQGELFYDANGNKRRQIETVLTPGASERQVITLWEYDQCNRLVSLTEAFGTPEQKCSHTVYNAYGQKELIVKADGTLLHHTYDLLGRVEEYYSNDGSMHYRFHYDARNNAIQVDDLVQGCSTYNTFDENNRLVKESLGNGLSCAYVYDAQGKPLKVTLPDGSAIAYGYEASQLKTVDRLNSEGAVAYTHEYAEYTLAGQQAKIVLANGLGVMDYTYDLLGRITGCQSPYLSETFEQYDSVGNLCLKTQKDPVGTVQNSYEYDDLYQVASEKGLISHVYKWDSLYNRVAKDEIAQEVNSLNQLTHNGHFSFEYDPNGNLIKKKGEGEREYASYAYDALDRLKTVSLPDGKQIRYVYDEQNRRLSRACYARDQEQGQAQGSSVEWVLVGEVERFLYLQQNEVGSVDSQGVIQELRILGQGKGAEIGAAVALEIRGKPYVPLHDQCGNVAVLVDMESKQVAESYRYSAFGEELVYNAAGQLSKGQLDDKDGHAEVCDSDEKKFAAMINPWRFSSKRVDPETGFSFFGRRYYDSVNGKWVTADPLGFEGGPNLYAYVLNNPLTHFDLYGLYGVGTGTHSDEGGGNSRPRTFYDRGMKFLKNMVKGPGRLVEWVGFNLVPIPIVRDGIEIAGRLASGKGLKDYIPSWKNHSFFFDMGVPDKDPNHLVSAVNGMMTSADEFIKRVWNMSDSAKGNNIVGIYNCSHGLVYDLIDCILQKCGIMTHSAKVALAAHRYMLNKVGSEGTIDQHAFSQGNLIMDCVSKHLSPSECKQINMHAYGSPAYFGENTFNRLVYANSCQDPIPFVGNPAKYIQHVTRNTGVITHSNGKPILDHDWKASYYQAAFQTNIDGYNKKIGA